MSDQELALIVLQQGKPQQVLAKFLNLMLNYQYGFSIVVAPELSKAASLLGQNTGKVRCVFVIQDEAISSVVSLQALSDQNQIPLFLILPTKKLGPQRMACSGMRGISFCAWEQAFSAGGASLQHNVGNVLQEGGVGNLFQNVDELPYNTMQQQVERRLRSINTLPTLPEVVMRIMRMVNDPKTTPDELERVLCTDPAIVMKLLQVMRSPVFTGTGGRTVKWTLKEIITRLGVKKVGAIAQHPAEAVLGAFSGNGDYRRQARYRWPGATQETARIHRLLDRLPVTRCRQTRPRIFLLGLDVPYSRPPDGQGL